MELDSLVCLSYVGFLSDRQVMVVQNPFEVLFGDVNIYPMRPVLRRLRWDFDQLPGRRSSFTLCLVRYAFDSIYIYTHVFSFKFQQRASNLSSLKAKTVNLVLVASFIPTCFLLFEVLSGKDYPIVHDPNMFGKRFGH